MKLGALVVVAIEVLSIDEVSFYHFVQVPESISLVLKPLVHRVGASVDVVHLLVQPLGVLANVHPLHRGVKTGHVVGVEPG